MRIKITESTLRQKNIDYVFAAINGRAISHTADHRDVFALAAFMEAKLDALGIPKKDRAGAIATGWSGGNVPSAYKYQRTVNRFQIERRSADWFMIDAKRSDIWGSASEPNLALTPKHRDIALAKFSQQFTVQNLNNPCTTVRTGVHSAL